VGSVGIPELIVIFVLVLLLFGPEKLPELSRNLGKAMAEFRRATTGLRGSFEEHLRELEREAAELERQREAEKTQASLPLPSSAPAAEAITNESSASAGSNPSIAAGNLADDSSKPA